MTVFLVNPSHVSFGIGVITPRWLYVLASATPDAYGEPRLIDETLEPFDPAESGAGDVVGIGIHTGNALRGYEIGTAARARGALRRVRRHPRHALSRRGARARRRARRGHRRRRARVADGAARLRGGNAAPRYDGGRVDGDDVPARPLGSAAAGPLHVGVGADRARLPEALLVLLGVAHRRPAPRQRHVDRVLEEIVELRRRGFRFIALADDNFYPVTLEDLRMADRRTGSLAAATG